MGTKSVRLDEEVYERVRAYKRDDETFSDAVARLIETYRSLISPRRAGSTTLNVPKNRRTH
ncbi:DUF7557 family protein [Halobellus ruber]|uniref:Uncharacterized protein n=1 Tax=Halobellus ruber TaxID=2761102 RepID=A0A7J9SN32_9EURY|nr:antitoxin VapB family protein [Halobellus ruber]MBB6647487.1 hypothetical protein [Halobellus ruber]